MGHDDKDVLTDIESTVEVIKEENKQKSVGIDSHPGELVFLAVLLILTLALLWDTLSLRGILQNDWCGPSSVPQATLFSMLIIIIMIFRFLSKKNYKEGTFKELLEFLICPEILILLAMVIVYALILPILHFKVTSLIFLFTTMYLLDRSKPIKKLIIAVGIVVVIVLIFEFLMKVVLP